jgi:hypothetical protein
LKKRKLTNFWVVDGGPPTVGLERELVAKAKPELRKQKLTDFWVAESKEEKYSRIQ